MAQLLKLVDGSIFKVDGKEVYEAISLGAVKQVDIFSRRMTIIGTDESVDRDGDIIRMNGWQLDNYRKNPVFLWAHNYSSVPLARAEKVIKRKDPPRMEHQLLYPTKGLHPFADMILELYGEKIINAASVGFIPEKWIEIEPAEGEKGVRRIYGREYTKQELLELSGCAVPSNPNALQDALKGKSFLNMPFVEVQKWLQGKAQPPKPSKSDDILGELVGKEADFEDEDKPFMVQVPDNICSIEEESEGEGQEVGKEDVLKPYPGEHACRLNDPGKYDRFARKNCFKKHDGKCVDFIFGIKEGKSEVQAFRYDKKVWEAGAARAHCSSHDGSFEAAKELEPTDTKEYTVILSTLSEIKELVNEVLEVVKTTRTTVTDLAKPIDQGQKGGEVAKSASEAILGEAFKQGRASNPPDPTPPPPQYDFRGVISALMDLKNALKPLKGE